MMHGQKNIKFCFVVCHEAAASSGLMSHCAVSLGIRFRFS